MEQTISNEYINQLLVDIDYSCLADVFAEVEKGDKPVFPEWYYALRDKKPGFQVPAKGKISGKVNFKIVDLPDGLSNNSKITCADCGCEKISRIIAHSNGSRVYLCKRHK